METRDKRMEKMLDKVRAKSFLEELAESGHLLEYIDEFLKEKYENDFEFKVEVLLMLYKYSPKVIPELNLLYLKALKANMQGFLLEISTEASN